MSNTTIIVILLVAVPVGVYILARVMASGVYAAKLAYIKRLNVAAETDFIITKTEAE